MTGPTTAVAPPRGLVERARARGPLATAVAGATSEVALAGAFLGAREGLLDPVLVGEEGTIRACAATLGWMLDGVRIVAADGEEAVAATSVALARGGEVGAIMKGHLHTDRLMSAVLSSASGLKDGRRLTHVFHLGFPEDDGHRDLLVSDAALNVAPDLETKIEIVANAVGLARAIGLDAPRVALLSCTEMVSDAIASSREAAEVVARCAAAGICPPDGILGPLAFDLAVSAEAARIKGVEHPVAGRAEVLVVPNIETGNALFKCLVHFSGATAAGLVIGAKVPIMLTSRADPPEARLASAALARLAAA